jgi:hypothetical protein
MELENAIVRHYPIFRLEWMMALNRERRWKLDAAHFTAQICVNGRHIFKAEKFTNHGSCSVQAPNSNIPFWRLVIGYSLEPGHWSLDV